MKRADNRTPSAILTADWHLRDDQPICRTDDFWSTQWRKVNAVTELQTRHGCPVIHAGDLFHHWKPSPLLLKMAIAHLPRQFMTIYGQHDLPQHNYDLKGKSGIAVLEEAGALEVLKHSSWGQEPSESLRWPGTDKKMMVWHKFVWDGKRVPWPGCDEMTADEVLAKYKWMDIIVTGDHHKPFTAQTGDRKPGRILVNPGCLTRQFADYEGHQPRVYLWYEETNTVEPYVLEIEEGVIAREHIERVEERDKRIDSFISRLDGNWEVVISFEQNLKSFLSKNRFRKEVVQLVYKAIDHDD